MSAFLILVAQAGFYSLSSHFIFRKFDGNGSSPLAISVIFNLTATVSATLLLQIICEILNLFSQSLLLWKANMWLLMVLVCGVIPYCLLQSTLPKGNNRLFTICFCIYLFLFWRLGVFAQCQAGAGLLSRIVSRAGIIGVTLMAVVSGYGSVLTPMQLFFKRRPATTSESIDEYQQRFQQASAQLQARRQQMKSSNAAQEQEGWLMKRVNWFTGGGVEEELADLEVAVDAMNDEYERLKSEQEQLQFEKSAAGRVWKGFNHLLAAYSVYRIIAALFNVLLGRAGEADPVSVACGVLVHLFADWDVRLWAKEISFLFVGGVIISSGRSFFQEMLKLTKIHLKETSPTMILCTALCIGLYLTSTLLMLRLNLPPSARPLITQALEGIGFDFFERCFDFMYLAAAGITGLYLYMTRL